MREHAFFAGLALATLSACAATVLQFESEGSKQTLPDGGAGGGEGGSGNAGLTCDQLLTAEQNAFSAASSLADLSCQTAADCVVVWTSTDCWNRCATVVSEAGAAELNAALAQINGTTCVAFKTKGCQSNSSLPCAPYTPACVNHACIESAGAPHADGG